MTCPDQLLQDRRRGARRSHSDDHLPNSEGQGAPAAAQSRRRPDEGRHHRKERPLLHRAVVFLTKNAITARSARCCTEPSSS
jgi:hypothetical protein